jgi:hypothetical protein
MRTAFIALFGYPLLVSACSHTEVRQHAAIDTDHRTITVPSHKRGLMKGIAEALVASGWKVSVDQTAPRLPKLTAKVKSPASRTDVTPKEKADATKSAAPIAAAPRPKTRYRLTADFRDIDYCRGGRIVIYDIAIIDNENGAKVLDQGGRDCDLDIVQKFKAALATKPQ